MELAWNTQKNQMNDVKGKEMEQERKGKISNEDIDLDKTKNNYDLVEDERTLYQRVKNRVDELKENGSRVQKNSVVMYSNILTVPEEQAKVWGEEKTDDYFKACYEFFVNEFGFENVVSAKVHKDETAPHMHLHFVPVNKENGKLQARVSMNKAKINYIHDELPKFLQERGFDVVRGKGKTEKNIENIHEYKQIKELERKVEQEKNDLFENLKEYESLKEKEIESVYAEWHDEWLEIAEEYPDFVLVETINNEMIFVNENTPKEFKFTFKQVIELFKIKFKELKKYIDKKMSVVVEKEKVVNVKYKKIVNLKETVDSIIEPLGVYRRENEPVYFYDGDYNPFYLGTCREVLDKEFSEIEEKANVYFEDIDLILKQYINYEIDRSNFNKEMFRISDVNNFDTVEGFKGQIIYINPSKEELMNVNEDVLNLPRMSGLSDFNKKVIIQEVADTVIKTEKTIESIEKKGRSI